MCMYVCVICKTKKVTKIPLVNEKFKKKHA